MNDVRLDGHNLIPGMRVVNFSLHCHIQTEWFWDLCIFPFDGCPEVEEVVGK
jgi:hypothetical protein